MPDNEADQTNLSLVMDKITAGNLRVMSPHRTILDLSNHRAVGGNLAMSANVASSLSNLIRRERNAGKRGS